jgi:pyruvate,orthophosphate dikinase
MATTSFRMQLSTDDFRTCSPFQALIRERTGKDFPQSSDQLWGAIGAVFGSWHNVGP